MAINTNELAALVVQYIEKEVPDSLERATPLLNHLMKDGKKQVDGGLYVQFANKLIANNAQGFISGTNAVLDVTPSQQLVYGTLNWKYFNYDVNFTLQDFTIASGKEQFGNYIAEKVDGALADSNRALSTAVHGTSTTNAYSFEGMLDIVAASGTTYAGLLDTDYATGAYLPYINTSTTLNYPTISTMITQLRARTQGGVVDPKKMMGLMNPATYQRLMSVLQNQQVFFDVKDVAESGFDSFRVNGCDFFLDADVPGTQDGSTNDNYVYIFMKDVLKFYYRFGLGTKSPFDGEKLLPTQPIQSIQNFLVGNMVCTNRRMVAVNKTIIA